MDSRPSSLGFSSPIHVLIRSRAEQTPTAVAVEQEGRWLSYAELDRRANQLARRLRALGAGRESVVAVLARPRLETVVALLGIWKAGAVYLPLDPGQPPQRLSSMLKEARPRVLLTDDQAAAGLSGFDGVVAPLDDETGSACDPPGVDVALDDLAYLIFTSGSTGTPKAVAIEHRGIGNLLRAQLEILGVGAEDRVLQFASLSFDASIAEMVMALGSGATLCLADREALVGRALLDTLRELRISCAILPPSVLAHLPRERLPLLRILNVAGEVCGQEIVDRWAPGRRFFNHYGPTEATVWSTVDECHPGQVPTLGRTLPGVDGYVLDENLARVAVGGEGELHLGGVSIARGYLGRPALTAERFVPNPFGEGRLYKTGDRVRLLQDGRLQFLGRIDHQLKVRGFRIEPGEIEAVLRQDPAVREAVVLGTNEVLVAYLSGASLDAGALEARLRLALPDYMVPARYHLLAALPRNAAGKIDRAELSRLQSADPGTRVAPRTANESLVVRLFAEVLSAGPLGIDDDFFALGGHSLVAARLLWRIREESGVSLAMGLLADSATPRSLARMLDERHRAAAEPLVPSRSGRARPSSGQRRLWLIDQREPGRAVYNAPMLVRFSGGRADAEALARSLDELCRRHETLRSTFLHGDDPPVLVIASDRQSEAVIVDLRGLAPAAQDAELEARAREDAARPFELAIGPLLRATIFRLRDDQLALLLDLHHIVTDGWSSGVILGELAQLYRAFRSGRPSPLPELGHCYADFAQWEEGGRAQAETQRRARWWRDCLEGMPALALPTDRRPPAVRSRRGARLPLQISATTFDAVARLARIERATPFNVLLAVFDVLLARYSAQTDIVVGAPVANRSRREWEPLVGFFVNTLILRTDLSGDPSFRELLGRVREVTLGSIGHELPLEWVVEAAGCQVPFQVLFVMETAPVPLDVGDDLSLAVEIPYAGTALCDLTLSLEERDGGWSGWLEYDLELFEASSAERLAASFLELLEAAVAEPSRAIGALPLLSASERATVLETWNQTSEPLSPRLIHERFSDSAARHPELAAVFAPSAALTYGELERRSNQLARYLLSIGAQRRPVALLVEPAVEQAVGVLGILKAGAIYAPLDLSNPKERMAAVLAEANPCAVLVLDRLVDELPAHGARTVRLDADWPSVAEHADGPLTGGPTAEDLAYLLFTSGSTGRPNGVAMSHGAIANLVSWQSRTLEPRAKVLQLAALTFDVSVQEMFTTWATAGSLVLAGACVRQDMALLGALIVRQQIERAFLPVVVLQQLAERFWDEPEVVQPLREVFVAGEQLRITDEIQRLFSACLRCRLHNHYGPTETHVATAWTLPEDSRRWPPLPPIGRPIANTRVYVLDSSGEPVPVGVGGEIYLAGRCLASGYRGRPALTASRFVPDPFGPPGSRMYRTGDLGRWCADGTLEFLRRADQQLKIRGHRVEPGEIEAALCEHDQVQTAAVVLRRDSDAELLVAYVVPSAIAPTPRELAAHLSLRLPQASVPSAYVILDALPLTSHGKVDREALPAPARGERSRAAPPRSEAEERIARLWAQLLRVERVGVDEDFFQVGGHSLLAMQLATQTSRAFAVKVRTSDVFDYPTVAAQATLVEQLILQEGARGDGP